MSPALNASEGLCCVTTTCVGVANQPTKLWDRRDGWGPDRAERCDNFAAGIEIHFAKDVG